MYRIGSWGVGDRKIFGGGVMDYLDFLGLGWGIWEDIGVVL